MHTPGWQSARGQLLRLPYTATSRQCSPGTSESPHTRYDLPSSPPCAWCWKDSHSPPTATQAEIGDLGYPTYFAILWGMWQGLCLSGVAGGQRACGHHKDTNSKEHSRTEHVKMPQLSSAACTRSSHPNHTVMGKALWHMGM